MDITARAREDNMKYEALIDKQTFSGWRVEAIDFEGDGDCFVTLFSGPGAEKRATEYAAWKNAAQSASVEEVAREIFKPRVWPIGTDLSKICCYRIDWSESEVAELLRQHGCGAQGQGVGPLQCRECNALEGALIHIPMFARKGVEYHEFKRPFCESCDHGVVAGKVCDDCKGTGYQAVPSPESATKEIK